MALAAAFPVVAEWNRVRSPWAGSAGTAAAASRTERCSPRIAATLSAITLGLSPAKEHFMKSWRLADITYGLVKSSAPFEVAVLPLGATEPHNLHLPYGTDTTQVDVIGDRACAIATEQGARVVLLPAIPYGTETNQMKFPLAMNVNPSTLGRVITDLVESLASHGVRKVVLLNGHGGNDLKWLLRELHR